MKSIISILLILLTISLSACGTPSATTSITPSPSFPSLSTNENSDSFKEPTNNTVSNSQTSASFSEIKPSLSPSNPVVSEEPTSESVPSVDTDDLIEALEEIIEKDVEDTLNELEDEWKTLEATVTSYENYVEQSEKIENFYVKIEDSTENLCIRLYQYTLKYADIIMSSNESLDDRYDLFNELSDCIYEKATDDISDEIYDGILDDMGKAFYDGVLEDAQDSVPYSEWSDIRSNEYRWWSDARSSTYSNYSDTRSDVYRFTSNICTKLYNHNIEEATAVLEKYRQTAEKVATKKEPITIESFTSQKDIESAIQNDIENAISVLEKEWDSIDSSILTYQDYVDNVDQIEAFYEKIDNYSYELCIKLYLYTLQYADTIMTSDKSLDDKYDLFDELLDCIYRDASDEIHDRIYNGILEEMSDSFYEGILEDAKDDVPYSEWSNRRSNEYHWWSNTRSSVYSNYSNTRSDIYSFGTGIRSKLYSHNIEQATIKLERFRKDVNKINR